MARFNALEPSTMSIAGTILSVYNTCRAVTATATDVTHGYDSQAPIDAVK